MTPRCLAFALAALAATGIRSVAAQDHAPLPERLQTAKVAYLLNDSGDIKAFDGFFRELKEWSRFSVVTSPASADVAMVLTTDARYGASVTTGTAGSGGNFVAATVPVSSDYLWLKVFDARTGELLWSDSTVKWVTAGHAPAKLVSNLRKRLPVAPARP